MNKVNNYGNLIIIGLLAWLFWPHKTKVAGIGGLPGAKRRMFPYENKQGLKVFFNDMAKL